MKTTPAQIIGMGTGGFPDNAIERVVSVLSSGGVILYPTDTIYGLGCLADNRKAIERLYSIKGRPESKPSLVLIDSVSRALPLVKAIPRNAYRLMERYWPGPLTIVLNAVSSLSPLLTGGTASIGIRLPAHDFCREIVARCGIPLVSTSANRSGSDQPGGMNGLIKEFSGEVDLILDEGVTSNIPSTVVDLTRGEVRIVRDGIIGGPDIRRVLGVKS